VKPSFGRVISAVTCVALFGACGITGDPTPRDIPADQRKSLDDRAAADATNVGARGVKLYFLVPTGQGVADRLQSSDRSVANDAEAIARELLKGLNDADRERKLRTSIPTGILLRSASTTADGTAVVDLDNAFFNARGDQQSTAVAQIVFTMTAMTGVREVRLLVDGRPREWPRGDGTLQAPDRALTRSDFAELNPTSQPDYLPIPSPKLPEES
jgi:spore germination protein GerM